jgi:7,8-dihydroneopterin aldolase/epimerase/oxygenase
MAVIRLEGLSVFGHHGASAPERRAGTRLDVDVTLELDTRRAETSDRLADTVSYDDIEAAVRKVVEGDSFRLLEALAAHVADTCIQRFGATRISVRLTKQNLAWPTGGRVVVEVAREGGAAAKAKAKPKARGR